MTWYKAKPSAQISSFFRVKVVWVHQPFTCLNHFAYSYLTRIQITVNFHRTYFFYYKTKKTLQDAILNFELFGVKLNFLIYTDLIDSCQIYTKLNLPWSQPTVIPPFVNNKYWFYNVYYKNIHKIWLFIIVKGDLFYKNIYNYSAKINSYNYSYFYKLFLHFLSIYERLLLNNW